MYEFIKLQWVMRKFNEAKISACVANGYITQEQADAILMTPQTTEEGKV